MAVALSSPAHDLSLCIPDLKSKKKDSALAEMIAVASAHGLVRDPGLLLELLKLRERLGSTALGKGVAMPHARSLTVRHPRIVVARSPRGIDWGAADAAPVGLVVLVLAPAEHSEEAFHALLARAGATGRLQRTRQRLLAAPSLRDLSNVVRGALA